MANQQGSLADQGIPHRSRVAKRASKSSARQWPLWFVLLLGLGSLAAWQWQIQQQVAVNHNGLRQILNQQTQLAERLDQLGLSEQSFASMLDLEELTQQQQFFAQQLEALQNQPVDTWRGPLAELERVQQELAAQILMVQQAPVEAFDDQPLRQALANQEQALASQEQALVSLRQELQQAQDGLQQQNLTSQLRTVEQQIEQLASQQRTLSQELASSANAPAASAVSSADLQQLRNQLSALNEQISDLAFRQELQRSELLEIRTAAGTDITLEQWIRAMDANRLEMTQRLNALMTR